MNAAAIEYLVRLKRPHVGQARFIDSKAKRKIIRAGRRGGKTTGIAIPSVEDFLAGHRVLYAAPTEDQVARYWQEVTAALLEPIEGGIYRKNETKHIIELPGTEQRIRAKTAWNADTLRGDYADRLILDEFQLMSEDTWGEVGAPMLLDNNGNAVFIYTPPSLHSKSTTKATDKRHASKMFQKALDEMKAAAADGRTPRWEAFHFTSKDNPHISAEALSEIAQDMTALAYRQEIMAEDIDEVPGALWKRTTIDNCRRAGPEKAIRMGVGVDPPGGSTYCGIVAAGIGECTCKGSKEIHGFVFEDDSLRAPPDVWAKAVCDLYEVREADRVFGEKNFGGDMVRAVIKTANEKISYQDVHASRGKAVRAEPVAALYEQGKVHHVGQFPELEDELCGWAPGDPNSPNRLDALVWVLTELMLKRVSWRPL